MLQTKTNITFIVDGEEVAQVCKVDREWFLDVTKPVTLSEEELQEMYNEVVRLNEAE